MGFDYKTFSELLGKFVIEGEKIKMFRGKEISEVIAPLCKFLRIAKFSAVISDTAKKQDNKASRLVYYDEGNADENRCIEMHEELVRNGAAEYRIIPAVGEPDWSDEERAQISLFEKQMLLFTERIYTLKLMTDLTLEDSEFGLKTLTYLMTTANQIINQGHISEYGAAFFNLRRFSLVNEKIGRNTANKVMVLYAQGLQGKLNNDGCVCRVGGDNFAVLFRREHLNYIKKYLSGRNVIYGNDQDTIKISATAGFYLIPEGTESASEIMDRASAACQLARNVFN